jgi:hypothetical protein
MDTLLSICLGIALAAACGFRVFVPLFVLSLASRMGWVEVSGHFAWLSGNGALLTFGAALILEVAAYYVPWLDNLLDAAAGPLAVGAGILASASVFTGLDPLPRWTLAIVAGGGAAAGVQGLTTVARAFSSFTTGGLGNFVVATGELLLAVLISALAVVVPIVALAVALILLALFALRGAWRRVAGNAPPATA